MSHPHDWKHGFRTSPRKEEAPMTTDNDDDLEDPIEAHRKAVSSTDGGTRFGSKYAHDKDDPDSPIAAYRRAMSGTGDPRYPSATS